MLGGAGCRFRTLLLSFVLYNGMSRSCAASRGYVAAQVALTRSISTAANNEQQSHFREISEPPVVRGGY